MLLIDLPEHFTLKAEVAGVLPFTKDKILLLQRLPSHPQANLWCAPGGKVVPGEEPIITAIRELKEETGIEVGLNSLSYLGKFYVRYPNGDFIFHLFETELQGNHTIITLSSEHQSYGFYALHELGALPLTPGLDECIELALVKKRRGTILPSNESL